MPLEVDWARMTADELAEACGRALRLCIVPIGVLERHGPHLPLGTDVYEAEAIARAAAAKEYAVVAPSVTLSINSSSINCPGALNIRPALLLEYLQNLCDEIARNGFTKILLLNCHGGNRSVLPLFLSQMKCLERDYDVYLPNPAPYSGKEIDALLSGAFDNHAGEMETSLMLHLHQELVRQEKIPPFASTPRPDYPVAGAATTVDWVASFPDHYAGNAPAASAEKGARLLESMASRLASVLRTIKEDCETATIRRKFQAQAKRPINS